jgi:hypothetical protein
MLWSSCTRPTRCGVGRRFAASVCATARSAAFALPLLLLCICFLRRSQPPLDLALPHQVEHWACLEELRTLHGEFEQGGGTAVSERPEPDEPAASSADEAAAAAASAGTFRELLHALQLVQPRRGPQPSEVQQQVKQQPNGDAMDVDEVQQPGVAPAAGKEQPGGGAGGEQQRQPVARRYGDAVCGYGSDDEPPTFTDAEDAVLGLGRGGRAAGAWAAKRAAGGSGGGAAADERQLEAWRQRFNGNAGGLADLERVASASAALFMDAQGEAERSSGAG